MRPIFLKKAGEYVACSRCPKCIARRVSGWSFRLREQLKISRTAHFLTMTYDSKYIPITNNGFLGLRKSDLQKFFKRLRKAQFGNSRGDISYYSVGEYGGKTRRPHYHCILFNAELKLIDPAWNLGMIHYGKVEPASIGYTLKYMQKNKKQFKLNRYDDRIKEFSVMSKGLGISYLNETMCSWHIGDLVNRCYCTLPGGVKIAMPRYYKDKIYYENERSAIAEAFALEAHEKHLDKLSRYEARDFRNEMAAIDAAFDRMYSNSPKTKL